jgi:cytochrome b561
VASLTGWLAAAAILAAGLVPLLARLRARGKRASPASVAIRWHAVLGLSTSALAFAHTLSIITALGSPAATAGGMLALLPGGVAFFVLIAHTGIGLQLRGEKLRERAAKRRTHVATALTITTLVLLHAGVLLWAGR